MVKTYKILNNNVYFSNNEQNIVTSDELIDEFLSGMDENEDADFILWNGSRPRIKRKLFEQFVDEKLTAI